MANSTEELSTVTGGNLGSLGNRRGPRFDIGLLAGGTGQTGTDSTGTIREFDKYLWLVLCSHGPDHADKRVTLG